nr:hypothetical protein [Tanacetum cinerariifolium]
MASKIASQDLEIASLKARIKILEDKDGGGDDPSGEDATIKGMSFETIEEAGIERNTDKGSNDTDEMAPQSPQHDHSSSIHPPVTTETIPTVIPTDTPPLRKQTDMASKIASQDLEIASLKARIKILEDKDGGGDDPSGEDATIKGMSFETIEEAGIERNTDKGSNDTDEMVNVLK